MTLAYWCVLIAGVMPLCSVAIAKWSRHYDNSDPRGWEEKLTGRRKRAHSAHLNSFEAFPLFAAGMIIAHLAQVPQSRIDLAAMIFIAARVIYVWLYLNDKARARSIAWLVGFGASIAPFVMAGLRGA